MYRCDSSDEVSDEGGRERVLRGDRSDEGREGVDAREHDEGRDEVSREGAEVRTTVMRVARKGVARESRRETV